MSKSRFSEWVFSLILKTAGFPATSYTGFTSTLTLFSSFDFVSNAPALVRRPKKAKNTKTDKSLEIQMI